MSYAVIIYEADGRYVPFMLPDTKLQSNNLTVYEVLRGTLTSEEGIRRYGIRFVAGKNGFTGDEIDAAGDIVSKLVERMNSGERVDLEKELAAIP